MELPGLLVGFPWTPSEVGQVLFEVAGEQVGAALLKAFDLFEASRGLQFLEPQPLSQSILVL